MSEPDISTLARRLAEQNNVDWRALSGSGPDGKVVERDVLDFLARVMAGEEAMNPTPEPLPEGMQAWPDQDLHEVRAGVGEAATLGNLRQELGNAVRPDDDADRAHPSPSGGADDPFSQVESVPFGSTGVGPSEPLHDAAVSVDEDIFLFDEPIPDDHGGAAAGASAPAAPFAPRHDAPSPAASEPVSDDLDDLLVAGDEFDGDAVDAADGVGEEVAGAFGGLTAGTFGEPDDDDAYAGAGAGADEPDSHGHGSEFAPDESDSGAEDSPWSRSGPSSSSPANDWGSGIALGDDAATRFGQGHADDAADLWGEPATTRSAEDSLWATDGEDVAEPVERDGFPAAGADQEAVEPAPFGEPVEMRDEAVEPPAEAEMQLGGAAEPALAADDELPGVASAPAATADLPLARSGMMLRRHIDLSALAASQLAVGRELGFDEPLGVAPFLLRAVAKAAGELGVQSSHVALAVLDHELELRRVDDAAGRSFASLVEALAGPAVIEDEPQLVAADLSGLDLDEALLDLDVTVVTLGRILYDNQRGAYRSTLSLSGASQPDAGARLLARIAELLDAPVRLVL